MKASCLARRSASIVRPMDAFAQLQELPFLLTPTARGGDCVLEDEHTTCPGAGWPFRDASTDPLTPPGMYAVAAV
eukprot:scaffold110479_cov31-Tisochrysis_lutea.AAC.3